MIPTYEQIENAWREVRRGKTALDRYQRYEYYLDDHIYKIRQQLASPDFKPLPMGLIHIDVPKPRIAQVPTVRDKIIMHALCDNTIYPAVASRLGDGNSACLIGRGTEYGTARLSKLLRDYWHTNHEIPWILKGDIHSYFASVSRERLVRLAGEVITDPDILRISKAYIQYNDSPIGMPLGLQQSQCYGNLYLETLDQLITEDCGYQLYGRHMDDFYVIAPTYEELERLLGAIEKRLTEIGLELNPKTTIQRGRVDYLGFTHILTEDGKSLVRLQNGKKKAKKRELRMVVRELANGNLTPEQVQLRYQGWRQRVLRAGCRNVVIEMDRHFTLLLNKAGYRTRTTMKGVEIIGKSNRDD